MPAVITNKFRIHNAMQFKESLDEPSNTILYFFIGGPSPWSSELSPPSPGVYVSNTEYDSWRDMFAAKRIQAGDVSHVIPRHDWVSGTYYTEYGDKTIDVASDSTAFYVVTDDYNVYKCISNNNGGPSTSKPTGTSTFVETYGDSYKWKYMYSISTTEALKFVTSSYIPVKFLESNDGSAQWTVQQAAVDGAIDHIKLTSGGSGYLNTSPPTITIDGDGVGATASAVMSANVVSGINILTRGSGYTRATVTFSGGGAGVIAQATATAIISPKFGHGSNPIDELGGIYLLVNTRLDGSESGAFTTSNDFRRIGLIRDATTFGTSNRATASIYRQTYAYTLTSVTGTFSTDESATVIASGNTATVVEFANNVLYTTLPYPKPFQVGNVVTGANTGATGTVSSISTPGIQPYSGDVIYMENRVATARATDQVEDIKLIIKF